MRITWPGITPLCVSIDAFWPMTEYLSPASPRFCSAAFNCDRLRDFREHGSLRYSLADFHVQFLQHAVNSRPDVQPVNLRFVQPVERSLLIQGRLLHGKLGINRICKRFDFFLREIVLFGKLFGLLLRLSSRQDLAASPLVRSCSFVSFCISAVRYCELICAAWVRLSIS